MTTTEKQKRLTITENQDAVLRLDNGDPGPLRTLHILLAFTDMILHGKIANMNVFRYVLRTQFSSHFFVQVGCKKPTMWTVQTMLN